MESPEAVKLETGLRYLAVAGLVVFSGSDSFRFSNVILAFAV